MKKKFLGTNWFFEDFYPQEPQESTWGFKIKKEVFSKKSPYQKIEIFETEEFGRILMLDGLVQLSTRHEHVYHEMLAHPAMFYHKKPERVLIVGGGDGGALREVAKHKSVKEIFLVDIDRQVVEASKKYLPSVSGKAFEDKRLKIFAEDAFDFVKARKNYFDIVIFDLTDPTPVAKFCWNVKFYRDIAGALGPGGVASFQTGQLSDKFAKKVRQDLAKTFSFFSLHKAFVENLPFSEYTFSFVSEKVDFKKINLAKLKKKYESSGILTRYYSPDIHFASQVFPKEYVSDQ